MTGMRIKVNLIAFLVISLGLVYGMATQVLSILQPRYSVFAMFPDAGGVFTDQEVTYRGVTVGQVGAMEVTEEGVRIELNIDDAYDEIPKEDVEARVMFKSAVGEQFVDLLPAGDAAPYLQDGDTIPMDQNTIPVSTQELLTTVEAVLRGVPPEALEGAVDALGIGLTGHGPDIATIIESMADLAEVFADRAPEVQGILREGTEVGAAFVDSGDDFKRAIRHLVEVSEELSQDRPDITRLLQNTSSMSDGVEALLTDYEANIDRLLPRLAELNALQADHTDDLAELLIHLPSGLDRVVRSFEPKTGLIRFGLVNDSENPACSYGTERRTPYDRGFRKPPKNAGCGSTAPGSQQQEGLSASRVETGDAAIAALERAVDDGAGSDLPQRMSDWSWSLLYLNGI